MDPSIFSRKDYQEFFQFCQKRHPEVAELFLRYELEQLHQRYELALDFSEGASKKYYNHLKQMQLVLKEQGPVAAEAMLEENDRLEAEMNKADRQAAKLERQMDRFSMSLKERKSC